MKFEGRGDIKYIAELDRRKPTYKIIRYELMTLIKGMPKIIEKDTILETTIKEIKKMTISQTHSVKDLAARLYTGNAEQDCYHVWHWIKTNISYKLDPRGTERIRNPKPTAEQSELIKNILGSLNLQIQAAQRKFINIDQQYDKVMQAAKSQVQLFGLGAIPQLNESQ